MKLHAIQTGSVRIKTAQVHGQGRGLFRLVDRSTIARPREGVQTNVGQRETAAPRPH